MSTRIQAIVVAAMARIPAVARLVEDAERYRWLRSDDIEVPDGQREIVVRLERLPFREDQSDEILIGAELDAAIDSAQRDWTSGDRP